MAAALIDQFFASQRGDFLARVTASMMAAAQAISTEATSTPNHANRVALMKNVTNNPAMYAQFFAQAVAAQAIDTASTDAQINGMVSSVWNSIAGVP